MTDYKLAAGHNNAAGLVALESLLVGSFSEYRGGILTEWHDAEAFELDGARHPVAIGRPYVVWHLWRLTQTEFQYLKTTFCGSATYGDVTLRTLNKRGNAYQNFNAVMHFGDVGTFATWGKGVWDSARIEFRDLVAI